MGRYDVTQTDAALRRLLETTTNPRHRHLIQVCDLYRCLRLAGRYREIFTSGITVERPVWHFNALGLDLILDGREEIETIWEEWTKTGQCIFYAAGEKLAVGDDMVASTVLLYQQTPGQSLAAIEGGVDTAATYLIANVVDLTWLFDDQGRVIRQCSWEIDPSRRQLIKLDAADVLSPQQAAQQLDPLIKSAAEHVHARTVTG